MFKYHPFSFVTKRNRVEPERKVRVNRVFGFAVMLRQLCGGDPVWSPDWIIPPGILVIPHPSRLRRATFPSGKAFPSGYLVTGDHIGSAIQFNRAYDVK